MGISTAHAYTSKIKFSMQCPNYNNFQNLIHPKNFHATTCMLFAAIHDIDVLG